MQQSQCRKLMNIVVVVVVRSTGGPASSIVQNSTAVYLSAPECTGGSGNNRQC